MEILQDLRDLLNQAENLGSKRIDVSAHGVYPNRKRTIVQDVAVYQNDGTPTITPAKFVERAEGKARRWESEMDDAVRAYLDGKPMALDRLGERISRDVNDTCDRIKSRRLKHSFRHVIKNQ